MDNSFLKGCVCVCIHYILKANILIGKLVEVFYKIRMHYIDYYLTLYCIQYN